MIAKQPAKHQPNIFETVFKRMNDRWKTSPRAASDSAIPERERQDWSTLQVCVDHVFEKFLTAAAAGVGFSFGQHLFLERAERLTARLNAFAQWA